MIHIGHHDVIIYPIDSNGDPHGLWQFIVHHTMNVGHHNMPYIQAKKWTRGFKNEKTVSLLILQPGDVD